MNRPEAALLLDSMRDDLAQVQISFTQSNEPDASILLNHLRSMAAQLRADQPVTSVIHSSWQMVLKYKNHPIVEPYLRRHGRDMVGLFKTL